MHKAVLYGVIAAVVIAAGVGIAFASMSAGSSTIAPSNSDNDIRVIKHAMGETEIAGIPERAVVMDIVTLETFLELGIEPVGLSSLDIQKRWNPEISTEWPNVVDVGNTCEPNLEVIAQLEPDVIFASESEHSEIYDELAAIAPTIMLNNWPYEDGPTMLQAVEQNIMTISDATGRKSDGQTYLNAFHQRMENYRSRIDSAGLAGSRFILANAVAFEGQPGLFLFVPGSQNSEILERMGLKNAVLSSEEFARYGHTEVSLEALVALDGPDVHFIYVTTPGAGDPIADPAHWKNHPVWNNLSFVKEGRVHHIGQINMFRGPIELEKVAQSTIDALADSTGTRTVRHEHGDTTITGTPQRVVLLTLGYPIESMLAFDIEPAGIALLNVVRNQWGPDVSHWTETADVGTIVEPNFETIAQLEPDLIVGTERFHGTMYDKLSEIAPTVLISYPAFASGGNTPIEEMEENFMVIADALNKHDEGVTIIEEMHAKLDAAKSRLEAAGAGDKKVIMGLAWTDETTPYIRLSGGGKDLQGDTVRALGLTDAVPSYNDEGFQVTGRFEVDLEGLATLDGPDVYLLYTVLTPSGADEAVSILEASPVWNNLSFVKEERVHNLGYIDSSGPGPLKLPELADRIVNALTH